MMMIRPAPLPDEIARGYLGRIMRLNGWATLEQALHTLKHWSRVRNPADPGATPVDRLARVAGLTSDQFIQQHSLIAYIRAFAPNPHGVAWLHGDARGYRFLRMLGLGCARKSAHLCPQCVQEDLAFHGFSYWRRSHQLPGTYWCAKHGCALHFFMNDGRLYQSPAHVLERCTCVDEEWVRALRRNPWIRKALDISGELARGKESVDVNRFAQCVRGQAVAQGYGTVDSQVDVQAIFRALHAHFDERWLRRIMLHMEPSRFNPSGGQNLHSALRGLRPSVPTIVYAVLMSLLYRSADDAISAVHASHARQAQEARELAAS